jgi:signal transduction histidine kinase
VSKIEMKQAGNILIFGALLILVGFLLPVVTESSWFEAIYKIRKAIQAGDSGHLILAAASINTLNALQSTTFFLGVVLIIFCLEQKSNLSSMKLIIIFSISIIMLHEISAWIFPVTGDIATTILALLIAFYVFRRLFRHTNSFLQVTVVSIQVFYAFQWLNIMPLFSSYNIGHGDIYHSIKQAGIYLQTASVLNFAGLAFFFPFVFSAFVTTTLFISSAQNIVMLMENYEKERELQNMKSKVLENRIYNEVKSLVHDLKTPLVTIRGLNSLLAVSKDSGKLEEYSSRIDSSVEKMNEMISSFLFDTSRQKLQAEELISYIRAQLPLEDESIKIELIAEERMPVIYVNKVRMARAIINILENAIVVPHKHLYKHIVFEAKADNEGLLIAIKDNGIGIKEADLAKIWEVGFSTSNTSGLGLPFAKQIIEDHGGRIDITSTVDVGTEVLIYLPSAT